MSWEENANDYRDDYVIYSLNFQLVRYTQYQILHLIIQHIFSYFSYMFRRIARHHLGATPLDSKHTEIQQTTLVNLTVLHYHCNRSR
jgi:hypothetical protein